MEVERKWCSTLRFSKIQPFLLCQMKLDITAGRFWAFSVANAAHQFAQADGVSSPCQIILIFRICVTCCQIPLVVSQCRKRWFEDSSLDWQSTHQDGPAMARFLRASPVGNLFASMFHKRSLFLGCACSIHTIFHQPSKLAGFLASISLIYPSLGEYIPDLAGAQIS